MNDKQLLKKSSQASLYLTAFKIPNQLLSFVSITILVRVLSKHDYGIYNLLYSIIAVFSFVASFGLVNALSRYVPEYFKRGEFFLVKILFINAAKIRLATSMVILSILFFFWDDLSPYLKLQDYKNYFIIFIFIILSFQQWQLVRIVLNSFFLHKLTEGTQIIFTFLKIVGYSLAFCFKVGLLWILYVDLFSFVLLVLSNIIIFKKKIPQIAGTQKRFPEAEKKRVFRYGLYYNFNDVGTQLLDTNIDNIVIASFLDPISVGIYAFCNKISKMIEHFSPINYLADVIRPAFISVGIDSDRERIKTMVQFLIKCNYAFYIPILFLVALSGREAVSIIFGKYEEYHLMLAIVFAFATFNAVDMPIGLVTQLKERSDILLLSRIFGIYNLIADVVFIKLWGIMGVVIATGTAGVFKNILIYWLTSREYLSLREIRGFLLNTFLYWAICAIFLNTVLSINNSLLNFLIWIFLFALFFIIYLYCFTLIFLNNNELRIFTNLIGDSNARKYVHPFLNLRSKVFVNKALFVKNRVIKRRA